MSASIRCPAGLSLHLQGGTVVFLYYEKSRSLLGIVLANAGSTALLQLGTREWHKKIDTVPEQQLILMFRRNTILNGVLGKEQF